MEVEVYKKQNPEVCLRRDDRGLLSKVSDNN
jgi:adenylylsulfate kinase-like enzyme